ncbi:MAG: hypothetical protein QOH81_2102 [Sphingomonadales bacterium]|jgi:hypothetical protein|nr:hypothetical protein [Sphingomonadales bacterium]
MARPNPLLPLLAALAALAGCAAPGPYPSLAPRPIEKLLGEPGVPPVVAPLPDDPAVAARVAAFLNEAQAGDRAFRAAFPAAETAVARAGPVGSDSWLQAQQAVSRAQAAQAETVRVLAELDRYGVDRAHARALSASDLQRLQTATAEVQRRVDAGHAEIVRLQAALRTP